MSECENCEQLDYAAIFGDAMRMERGRIIKLLEANHLTAASELIEQDALGEEASE